MRVTKASLALTLGAVLALTACAPSADPEPTSPGTTDSQDTEAPEGSEASGDPVKVGVITSLTGPLGTYGEAYVQGLEAGFDYATGGTMEVGGIPIELEVVDDGGDTDRAVSEARDLIGQGYQILAGTASSGIALSLAEQAAQNQVLYISGPAAADPITGINEYTFRSGRQSIQDVATAGTFIDPFGQRVVVFAQDNAFGQGNLTAVEAILGEAGADVVAVLVPEDVTEFTPFAAQILNAEPEMVFVAWAGATSGAMWQALDQQGVLDDLTVVTGLGDVATYGAFGPASDRISFLNHYFKGAAGTDVEAAMIEHVEGAGGTVDLFTPDGFVAAQMIVRAIEETGGQDVDAMIAALEGWSFEGPKGSYTIRDDHALIQPMFQARLVDDGGEWVPELVEVVDGDTVAPPAAS